MKTTTTTTSTKAIYIEWATVTLSLSSKLRMLRVSITSCLSLLLFFYSSNKDQLQLYVLHWKGRIRKGMEGREEEDQAELCYERDAKGKNHNEEVNQVSHERETDPHTAS